jgi:hypothetical protein
LGDLNALTPEHGIGLNINDFYVIRI